MSLPSYTNARDREFVDVTSSSSYGRTEVLGLDAMLHYPGRIPRRILFLARGATGERFGSLFWRIVIGRIYFRAVPTRLHLKYFLLGQDAHAQGCDVILSSSGLRSDPEWTVICGGRSSQLHRAVGPISTSTSTCPKMDLSHPTDQKITTLKKDEGRVYSLGQFSAVFH